MCFLWIALRVSEWTGRLGQASALTVTKPFADEDVPERIESNKEEKKNERKKSPQAPDGKKTFYVVLRMC